MLDILTTLNQVETGEFRGVGSQMVALTPDINLPDTILVPKNDNGIGVVARYLSATALSMLPAATPDICSPTENGKIVDKRLLAWLLIGRETGSPGLCSDLFLDTAEKTITKAARLTTLISQLDIFRGGVKSTTDWRSLFEGIVKADIFGKDFQPTIVTSLGGYDGQVPLAAPFNILPALELAQTMREAGLEPRTVITSAAKYGVDCNGLEPMNARRNWQETFQAYQKLMSAFYPEALESTSFETLYPGGIKAYPKALVAAAWECCDANISLKTTADQYGAGKEEFVNYMLSHTQAFRDFQMTPEAPFVVKVGAPSEQRFSRWQKQLIERAMPLDYGFVPNMARTVNSGYKYGQISLYYPRLGNRPPYYPDSVTAAYPEPALEGRFPDEYWDFLYSIPDDNPSLGRYDDLRKALELTRVKPDEYVRLFSGGEKRKTTKL